MMNDFPTPSTWQDPQDAPPPPPPGAGALAPYTPPPPPPPATHGHAPSPYSAFGVTTAPIRTAPVHPVPQKKGWSAGKIIALVAVLGFVLLGAAVAVVFGSTQLMSFAVDQSVPTTAEIGDCYGRFESFELVPCDGLHHYEVYDVIVYLPETEYPGRLSRLAGELACEESFEWYTGETYWSSDYDYSIPLPSREAWDAGERRTVCALHHVELKPLLGTDGRG